MVGFLVTALAAIVGAIVGLIVATLVNSNCDSLIEQLEGCSRLNVGVVSGYGFVAGALVGVVGVFVKTRR